MGDVIGAENDVLDYEYDDGEYVGKEETSLSDVEINSDEYETRSEVMGANIDVLDDEQDVGTAIASLSDVEIDCDGYETRSEISDEEEVITVQNDNDFAENKRADEQQQSFKTITACSGQRSCSPTERLQIPPKGLTSEAIQNSSSQHASPTQRLQISPDRCKNRSNSTNNFSHTSIQRLQIIPERRRSRETGTLKSHHRSRSPIRKLMRSPERSSKSRHSRSPLRKLKISPKKRMSHDTGLLKSHLIRLPAGSLSISPERCKSREAVRPNSNRRSPLQKLQVSSKSYRGDETGTSNSHHISHSSIELSHTSPERCRSRETGGSNANNCSRSPLRKFKSAPERRWSHEASRSKSNRRSPIRKLLASSERSRDHETGRPNAHHISHSSIELSHTSPERCRSRGIGRSYPNHGSQSPIQKLKRSPEGHWSRDTDRSNSDCHSPIQKLSVSSKRHRGDETGRSNFHNSHSSINISQISPERCRNRETDESNAYHHSCSPIQRSKSSAEMRRSHEVGRSKSYRRSPIQSLQVSSERGHETDRSNSRHISHSSVKIPHISPRGENPLGKLKTSPERRRSLEAGTSNSNHNPSTRKSSVSSEWFSSRETDRSNVNHRSRSSIQKLEISSERRSSQQVATSNFYYYSKSHIRSSQMFSDKHKTPEHSYVERTPSTSGRVVHSQERYTDEAHSRLQSASRSQPSSEANQVHHQENDTQRVRKLSVHLGISSNSNYSPQRRSLSRSAYDSTSEFRPENPFDRPRNNAYKLSPTRRFESSLDKYSSLRTAKTSHYHSQSSNRSSQISPDKHRTPEHSYIERSHTSERVVDRLRLYKKGVDHSRSRPPSSSEVDHQENVHLESSSNQRLSNSCPQKRSHRAYDCSPEKFSDRHRNEEYIHGSNFYDHSYQKI